MIRVPSFVVYVLNKASDGGTRHLKKGRRVLCQGVRLKYAFIKQLSGDYSIRRLCLTLKVHPSGYYAWLSEPKSARAKEDQRLLGLIKHSWLESGGVYGYRKIHDDLREVGESCGRHRVARLMRFEGLRSQTGYRRRPGKSGGKPAVASPNLLKRQSDVRESTKCGSPTSEPMKAGCTWP